MELVFYIAGAVAVISTGLMLTEHRARAALPDRVVAWGSGGVLCTRGPIRHSPRGHTLGAIMVLFVFVVMMLNLGAAKQWLTPGIWTGPVLLTTILIIEVLYLMRGTMPDLQLGPMFGPYLIGVELASMLLSAA